MSQNGGWQDIPLGHFERARELRREMTPPEREMWRQLRGSAMRVKFRRQHPIGPYIADFYARQASLVIEIDGVDAHSGVEAVAHDAVRDRFMREMGLTVIRVPASEWRQNRDSVLESIYHACAEHTLVDQPNKQWLYAENVQIEDIVYAGPDLHPTAVRMVLETDTDEAVYAIEVDGADAYLTGVCAVHAQVQ